MPYEGFSKSKSVQIHELGTACAEKWLKSATDGRIFESRGHCYSVHWALETGPGEGPGGMGKEEKDSYWSLPLPERAKRLLKGSSSLRTLRGRPICCRCAVAGLVLEDVERERAKRKKRFI